MECLSQEEAFRFLAEVLKIGDPKQKLKNSRTMFLEELLQAYQEKIPFHNIHLLNMRPEQRHVPTWSEIKSEMMQGSGGLCYTMSVFMKFLLDALDFNTCFLACAVKGFSDNHIATAILDLTVKGNLHLVDPTAYPTFAAIPLDFADESPVYNHSYLQYKFVKKANGNVLRMHRSSACRSAKSSPGVVLDRLSGDQWFQVCEINLTPQELSFFEPSMHTVFTVPGKNSPFLVHFRAVVFTDRKLVAFKDKILLLEREDHTVDEVRMASREEMIQTMVKYFPQFTEDKIAKALDSLKLDFSIN